MKKILISCVILGLGAIQLPVLSSPITTWEQLNAGIQAGYTTVVNGNNVVAPAGAPAIMIDVIGTTTLNMMNAYVTAGGGGNDGFNVGTSSNFIIIGANQWVGIASGGTGASVANNGTLTLNNMTLNNGAIQVQSTAVLDVTGGPFTYSSLQGAANNISGGTIKFTGTGNTLNIEGGSVGTNAVVNISAGNTFQALGGTVTLNGTGANVDTWAGSLNLSTGINSQTGTLILDNFTHSTTNGTFKQYDAATSVLNLTNSSLLSLDDSNSTIADGTVNLTGGSILNIYNGLSTNNTALVMGAGANSTFTIDNVHGTAAGMTLNSGSSIQSSNTINIGSANDSSYGSYITVGSGATIEKGAQINLYKDNLYTAVSQSNALNIAGGNVTFDSADILSGFINVTSGNSTFDGVNYNATGLYTQSGGTTSLTNASTFTLANGNQITGGNINIGVGSTTGSTMALSAGSITGTGTTVNIGTTTAGSTNNALTVSGTGNIDESATIVLNENNDLNIQGGTITLNQGGTTGNDILNGTVNMSAGTLTADSITPSTTGTFNHSGGSIKIGSDTDSSLPNDVHLLGVHNLTGGDIELRRSGKLTLDSADNWNGTNIANKGGAFTLDGVPSHNTSTEGTYSQTAGTTTLKNNSTLTTDLDVAGNALSGGNIVISDTSKLNLATTAGATVGASLSGDSTAIINKNGTGTLTLTGKNSGYYGALNVNAGDVDFNASSGNTDSYISGTTTLAAGSSLTLNTNGTNVISSSNNVSGGTVNKTGAGEYAIFAGADGNIDYTLNVNGGSMRVVADTPINFSNPVAVNSSILTLSAGDTNFNNGLTLNHGYLNILNGGFDVTNGGMTIGSTANTMNGVVARNNITGDLNIGASGTAEFLIDVSPYTATSDDYKISGAITKSGATGTINVSDFRIVGVPTDVKSVNLKIFDPTLGVNPGIDFTSTDSIIKSTASMYSLSASPLQNGSYTLNWQGYNPEAFRGQVATQAAYANQLTTNNVLFDHIGLVSQQLLSEEKPNVYANENPLYAPYQYSKKDGNLWYKAFGNLERLQLSQGINTQNNMWGSLVGADFPLVQLKNGWSVLPTAYVGYTGAYQTYSGVNMYQNGGQGGIMGTFFKGDFITTLLANVGGYGNDMSLEGTRDTTGNWFAGVASKSAYNIKLPKDFILQPNMLVSYNAFGGQNWGSDYGGTSMTTNMMNGLNLAPGLNLILNKKTWSVYATTQLMCNLMNGTSGSVGDVDLPTVKMASTYFQYGLGVTKRIKDRVSMYGQIVMSNGVRTGIGFQGGLQWKF